LGDGFILAKKKTTKVGKKDPVYVENFKPLKKAELKVFQEKLRDQRRQLMGDVVSMRSEALKDGHTDATGDLSSMPIHMADIGTDNYEQEFTLNLIASEKKILREIDNSLMKFDDGTYGICEATREPIGRARLNAKPYARFTIDYKRKLEKGLVEKPKDINGEYIEESD